jgi:Subtilase family
VLIVRTHQDAGVEADRAGKARGPAATALNKALETAEATLSPVAGEPRTRLAERQAAPKAIADIACYFGVAAPEETEHDLADRLREHPAIELAYVKRPLALPTLPPRAVRPQEPVSAEEPPGRPDDYRPRQGYLDPPPEGIGAEAAWTLPGGKGQGVRIIDVEAEWRFTHEDLQHTPGGLVGGRPADDVEFRNHGTNVIGMLGAVHNGRGISGICPDAAIKAVSFMPERRWGSARAIKLAADMLRPGDILLLEMMRPGPMTPEEPGDSQVGYLPVDYWPDDLTAIEYAVSRGVVVVEAAGNGFQHLDDPMYGGPGPGFRANRPNPFMREGLDSGAIVVGAGAPPPGTHGADYGPDRSRLDFSNWGRCLDAQGWGREVATTGGLGQGPDALRPGQVEDRWYTDRFSGTSSAAPMVAGALACVQGVLRAAGRRPLTPEEARTALRETGSPQQPAADGSLERIGNRPDVEQLIAWAMQTAPPAYETRTRRTGMKVTITIEDTDRTAADVFTATTNSAEAGGMEVPYIKGPSLVLTHEDGSKTQLDVQALKELVDEKKGQRSAG